MKLEEIAQLNNIGTALLTAGDGQKAIRTYTVALNALTHPSEGGYGTIADEESGQQIDFVQAVSHLPVRPNPHLDGFFLYDKALVLNMPNEFPSFPREGIANYLRGAVTAVIFFNLALASHSMNKLEEAEYLYDQAVHTLQRLTSRTCFSARMAELLVICLNNRAEACSSQARYPQASENMMQMAVLLCRNDHFSTAKGAPDKIVLFDATELQDLKLNALLGPCVRALAAAA